MLSMLAVTVNTLVCVGLRRIVTGVFCAVYKYSYLLTYLLCSRRTLSDVFDRADRYGDVVESGRVVCRDISVRTATALDHVTLIARLLTRLYT